MSELELLKWIRARLVHAGHVLVHSGDDLAVLKTALGERLAFGADTLVAGVDFYGPNAPGAHTPEAVGRKAVAVNVSDLAAMGARPLACVAAVVLPSGLGMEYAKGLYDGMSHEAALWEMPIVGGDISAAANELSVTVSVLGSYAAGETPLLRSSARPGDLLYVTGALGGSILGRHMSFTPRLKAGRYLAACGRRVGCIDISDGLSTDALHLAEESRVKVVLSANDIPVSEAARRLAAKDGLPALQHALNDGEDFELLFTLPAEAASKVLSGWPEEAPHLIGRIREGEGVYLEDGGTAAVLGPGGYEHRF